MDETTRVIEITSPEAAQGKSTVVANLAVAFSRIGIQTIVLDADLRRPRQHEIFGLDNSSGLSTMLALGRKPELKPAGSRPLGDHERPGPAGPDRDAPHPPAQRDQGAAAAQGADPRRHPAGPAGQRRAPRGAARRRRHPARDRGHAEARELPGRARPPRARRQQACSASSSTRPGADDVDAGSYYRYEATGETAERLEPPRRVAPDAGAAASRRRPSRRAAARARPPATGRRATGGAGLGGRAAARQPRWPSWRRRRSPSRSARLRAMWPLYGARGRRRLHAPAARR